jgi:RNA polymerase primary sigma factor
MTTVTTRNTTTDSDDTEVEVLSQVRGASTDQVGDYLRHIGRMPLLDAAEETEIARRIEVGLFAGEKLKELQAADAVKKVRTATSAGCSTTASVRRTA